MSSFSDYLENRKEAFNTMKTSLKAEINQESRAGNVDPRIWKPKMGQDGTGFAQIRLLPGKDFSKTPWIRVYSHGFQGPTGKWYIENSLTTLGQKDPVGEFNSRLWNNGSESGKEQARKQKRRTTYYANALVMKDPANPENEGKVVIYQFGQRIFDKLMTAMQPEFEDETPVNPFDPISGANFKIKIKMVAGYWNYDSSEFAASGPLTDNKEDLERYFEAQHDIHELIAPIAFKSYEELAKKLDEVMGNRQDPVQAQAQEVNRMVEELDDEIPDFDAKKVQSKEDDLDDDLEDFFKNLAD